MSTKKDTKRFLKPDYRFNSKMVSKFINKVMLDGKKSIAENIVYSSMDELAKKFLKIHLTHLSQLFIILRHAWKLNLVELVVLTYQVPMEVSEDRGIGHAMNWIIQFSRSRKGKSMVQNLSQELTDAFNNVGSSAKKRDDTHKMAESNKAFAHFRW